MTHAVSFVIIVVSIIYNDDDGDDDDDDDPFRVLGMRLPDWSLSTAHAILAAVTLNPNATGPDSLKPQNSKREESS